jgi:tetratricopeptide (TPR) repeat protein
LTSSAIETAEAELRAGRWQAARALALPFLNDRVYGIRASSVVANAATQMGDYQEAVTQLEFLSRSLPSNQAIPKALSVALNNLGSVAWQGGLIAAAKARYQEALAVDEGNSLAWFNLAVSEQTHNDFAAAAQAYQRCTKLEPSRHDARLQWAICERLRGAPDQARKALAGFGKAKPDARLAVKIGAEWDLLGDSSAAAKAYACAVDACDGDGRLILQIAQAQLGSGDATGAQATSRSINVQANDQSTDLRASLIAALAIPAVPHDPDEIEHSRRVFSDGVAALETDWPTERLKANGLSLDDLAHSHYMLAYQGRDDTLLAKAFGRWYGAAATAIAVGRSESDMMPGRIQTRRIALVSARWNMGTISAYFGSWIDALVDSGWDVQVFHLGSGVDNWTASIAKRVTAFHHIPGPLGNAVAAIQAAAPAMIIYPEVGLNPRVHTLAALRLAPVQAAAWGHPVSSGLRSIDVYFSCAEMEPPDAARHYSERLALLPHLGTNYRRPERVRAISRSKLGLPEGHPLYLAPHAPVKLQSEFDGLLAGIAQSDSRAKFVMFEDSVPSLTARLRLRIQQRFDQQGIDLAKHMIWLPRASPVIFRSVLDASNVLLDTPGFSGGNTSLDAIAQGLPLITMPGESMRSRQSAAMLRMCKADELIANSSTHYVDLAVHLAQDFEYNSKMRQHLFAASAELFDDQRPLNTLLEWVEKLNPNP